MRRFISILVLAVLAFGLRASGASGAERTPKGLGPGPINARPLPIPDLGLVPPTYILFLDPSCRHICVPVRNYGQATSKACLVTLQVRKVTGAPVLAEPLVWYLPSLKPLQTSNAYFTIPASINPLLGQHYVAQAHVDPTHINPHPILGHLLTASRPFP
jgi:hypothetical protein